MRSTQRTTFSRFETDAELEGRGIRPQVVNDGPDPLPVHTVPRRIVWDDTGEPVGNHF